VDHVDHSRATCWNSAACVSLQQHEPGPDQPPPLPKLKPMPKPKYTAQEQRAQREERRKVIYLRMAIWQELDARSITTPDDIGAALGMPVAEANGLLTRRQRRAGDLAALEAVAARLKVQVPTPWCG
jgi:hypothetical protein